MHRRSRTDWRYRLVVLAITAAVISGLSVGGARATVQADGPTPTPTFVNGEGSGGGG